jgi:CRISPR-associated endoribonuclease Cas6
VGHDFSKRRPSAARQLHASVNTGTNRMPQSLVINLVTQSTIPRQHLQGYFLQQLFFSLVDTVDPTLGNVLRRDDQNRSYSLSALQLNLASERVAEPSTSSIGRIIDERIIDERIIDERIIDERIIDNERAEQAIEQVIQGSVAQGNVRQFISKRQPRFASQTTQLQYSHTQAIAAKTACWWRISFLDDDLFDHLIFLWNQLRTERFSLGTGSVSIRSISADLPGLEWASSCSYREIYEQASERDRDIHLQFVTPTAFEKEGQMTPLPTAEAVFHPLRRRWNRYSGLAFTPNLVSHIIPTHFNIQTETTQRSRRKASESIVGCMGHISFRIAGDDDPLIIKRINTLANFTRYCGIGCNTLLGMGIVRRLSRPTLNSGLAVF